MARASLERRVGPACLALALSVIGCAHAQTVRLGSSLEGQPYRLGPADVVEVSVYKNPDLSRTVPVRPDGRISLPIVGDIRAAGLTPDELRDDIVKRLRTYIEDPRVVSVIVREVNSSRFYVVGEVQKPGVYPLATRVDVLQAIAIAGGLGEFSARDDVTLVRGDSGKHYTLALKDLESGHDQVDLEPGDTVVVR